MGLKLASIRFCSYRIYRFYKDKIKLINISIWDLSFNILISKLKIIQSSSCVLLMNYNYESDLSILHHSFLQRVVTQRTNINLIFILVARRFQNICIFAKIERIFGDSTNDRYSLNTYWDFNSLRPIAVYGLFMNHICMYWSDNLRLNSWYKYFVDTQYKSSQI